MATPTTAAPVQIEGVSTDDTADEVRISFREALRFWFKLGFISFGGPAGQIAIMHRELVERRRWISEERFLHALNFCMLLPGPEAQQLAIYIGWLKHRTLGGVVAGTLFVLPGFLLLMLISGLYVTFHELPALQGLLLGLKAAVLAVVLEAVHRIAKRALKASMHWWIATAAFIGIFALGIPFPLIVLGAGAIGFIVQRTIAKPRAVAPPRPAANMATSHRSTPLRAYRSTLLRAYRSTLLRAARIIVICAVLWFAPLLLTYSMLGGSHVLFQEGLFFSKMAVVTFGGAYAVLAYVAQQAVERYAWLSADQMMQGLALAETTPGPLILVLTFVGFIGAHGSPAPFNPLVAGALGAMLTTWVTFVPCFLWILLGAPHIESLRNKPALSAAMSAITAAVVGVILNLAVWFGLHAMFRSVTKHSFGPMTLALPEVSTLDPLAFAIAVASMLALLRYKAPMIPTLAVAGLAGLMLSGSR
jgi:chromate transporter